MSVENQSHDVNSVPVLADAGKGRVNLAFENDASPAMKENARSNSLSAKARPGLAFVSFAQGLSTFTWVPQLFAFLFYLMLFTLGVGSATSLTGGIISIICDQFPATPRWVITTIVCCSGFLLGLIYVTPGGQFMLELVDHFGANFVIYVMATIEVMGVAWVYGLNNFLRDIEFMLGIRIGFYWKFCWGFFVPVGLSVILFYALATDKRLTYNGWDYPDSAIVCGWMIAAFALSILPICAIQAIRAGKSWGFKEKFFESLRPTADWGPRKLKTKQDWQAFKSKRS
ncbi:unnamed protein product [Allacma fusca]|uniref:Sodium-dependent nutrient amino acid transporter 1 n=1 Tax=Allacma fusca TaxID=39272 RepID=A0A8J2J4B5_9HEXA|nr:unnamed protein product [Allacma fusca]